MEWKNLNRFATLQKELGVSVDQLHDLADNILNQNIYSLDDITTILNVKQSEFQEIFLSANTKGMNRFNLRDRALHVLQGELMTQLLKKKLVDIGTEWADCYFRIDTSLQILRFMSIEWIHFGFVITNASVASKFGYPVPMLSPEVKRIGANFG